MVLCVVDDLLFSVKISTAAKALGVETYFARVPGEVPAQARERSPSLIIFDLNSRKLQPLDAITALKADAMLKDIPTLGYVSHLDAEAISGARKAGIDEVLARSAFVEHMSEILRRQTPP